VTGPDPGVTLTRPVRRRPVFHELPVRAIDRLTEDALAITFGVPPELRDEFAFAAGQHVTVRRTGGDPEVRRSFSLCSTPAELAAGGVLRIGVKQLPGGVFSGYAASALRVGDPVDVMAPLGHFSSAFTPARTRHYLAVAAGSGITPVLSLVAAGLATEPGSRFTVLYGNRYARSVMFVDELADLKDRYPARLHLVHVLSREPGEATLLSGRIDGVRLGELLDAFTEPSTVDEWFLCGPYRMVMQAREVLAARGVPDRAVHTELFHVAEPDEAGATPAAVPATVPGTDTTRVRILLDGRSSSFEMGRDERVLDAALRVRAELPFACRGGVCSTCRARLVSGEVRMARNYALEPDELAAGYVLTCQSSPVSAELEIDYDG